MASSTEDEFGLSSSDEADLLALADAKTPGTTNGKRKRDEELSDVANKRSTNGNSAVLSIANNVLSERFGLSSFRLKQAVAIERLLEGQSAVVVFPTGQMLEDWMTNIQLINARWRQESMLPSPGACVQRD